jgi:hypothetical protein
MASCNKTSTVTVNVEQQAPGQAAIVSDSVVVLLVNTSNRNDFNIRTTSSQGVAIFDDVKSGSYSVSSEVWNPITAKGLYDTAYIQLQSGRNQTVNLLLQ